jgi:hypothetical protein
MKHPLFKLLILNLFLTSLVLGQGGSGPNGERYYDFRTSYVDFGTFAIDSGAATGQAGTLLSHVTIPLTAAQINGMYAAPVLLIAAPAAGHEILVAKASFKIVRSATAFANGGAAIIQYGSTTHGGGTQACDSTLASTVITGSAGTTHTWRSGLTNLSDNSALDATGLYISNATGAFDTGTGTAVVDVWYYAN